MKIYFINSVTRKITYNSIKKEALGGTQIAMFNLAEELSNRGHEVKIFCNCLGSEGIYDGIEYLITNKIISYSKEKPADILICVASESILRTKINAKKIVLWIHNDYSPYLNNEIPDMAEKISAYMCLKADKIVAVSNWQKDFVSKIFHIPNNHIKVIGNGVKKYHHDNIQKIKNRLIYISAPDRGLDILLTIFPELKKEFEDLELHIYSGFSTWGKNDLFHIELEKEIFQKAIQDSVFLHKPIPNEELSEKLKESYLMVYPNHSSDHTYFFGETFGLSVVEAQINGVPVISTKRGALSETIDNNHSGFLIEENNFSDNYRSELIEKNKLLLKNQEKYDVFSKNAIDFSSQFEIKNIANKWETFFEELINEKESTKSNSPTLISKYPEPEVSIVMPVYNRAKNLIHVLSALTKQTFKNFEVVIVDDGSTDNTKEVINSFRDKLNIRYSYAGENKGFRAARARNIGLSKVRGWLIIFLDSDIVTPSSYIDEHIKIHKKYDRILVDSFVYRMKEYKEEELGLIPEEYIPKYKDILNDDIKYEFNIFDRGYPIEEGYFLDSNSLSIKKEHIIEEGFDESFIGWGHEDTELGYRFASKNFGFVFIKENCESYHIFHYVSPEKDNETKVNWKRLTKKYDLNSWYNPLPKIVVDGMVNIINIEPEKYGLFCNIVNSRLEIKVGDKIDGHFPLINFKF
ncbi:MAG: glycosyltransferase [Cyanobacteriota bacterium]